MAGVSDRAHVRLAELVSALSLGVDLGFGQPMEHVLRQTLIAMRLAEGAGLGEQARADVYYTALLINVGCHSDAHEQAKWFGDDISLKAAKYGPHDARSLRAVVANMRRIGSGNPPLHRLRVGLAFALSGHRDVEGMILTHSSLARGLAAELGLPETVRLAVATSYERWDGRGWPGDLKGEEIPIASRVAQLADFVEVAHRLGGIEGATSLALRRRGRQVDPTLVDLLLSSADLIFDGLDEVGNWRAVIDAEPALGVVLSGERYDQALRAIANFVDIKSPYTLGHAVAVAALAEDAGNRLGLGPQERQRLHRAGLVHDFGRLGVSNAIWDKPGPLVPGEWERIRMFPYITERMLRFSESLSPLGQIAVAHRERLDGSGYPHGLAGPAISRPARILAAADAYQAMREPRPYRPPLSDEEAAHNLRDEVRAGRFDAGAVDAVLAAAGHRIPRRREGPAGLTEREVQVLKLLAHGLSNKEIAGRLVISPKTVGTHVEHIYLKIGASSRATASLFAVQNGLLPEGELLSSGMT
jgi:HD-GYP domain-containing protein (c-di-GMP phosphodiesterase class II)